MSFFRIYNGFAKNSPKKCINIIIKRKKKTSADTYTLANQSNPVTIGIKTSFLLRSFSHTTIFACRCCIGLKVRFILFNVE